MTLKGRIETHKASSNVEAAEADILRALNFFKKMQLKPDTAQAYMFLGEVYLKSGRPDKAVENLKTAQDLFKYMEMTYWIDRTEKLLANF